MHALRSSYDWWQPSRSHVISRSNTASAEGDPKFWRRPPPSAASIHKAKVGSVTCTLHLRENSLLLLCFSDYSVSYNGASHNNTSRLFRRPNNRPRRLRILPSSRRCPKIRRRKPERQWRYLFGLLFLKYHHGRGLPDPQRGAREDGQHRARRGNRAV